MESRPKTRPSLAFARSSSDLSSSDLSSSDLSPSDLLPSDLSPSDLSPSDLPPLSKKLLPSDFSPFSSSLLLSPALLFSLLFSSSLLLSPASSIACYDDCQLAPGASSAEVERNCVWKQDCGVCAVHADDVSQFVLN